MSVALKLLCVVLFHILKLSVQSTLLEESFVSNNQEVKQSCQVQIAKHLLKISQIHVNVTLLVNEYTHSTYLSEQLVVFVSALNILLNKENRGPFININLAIQDLKTTCNLNPGTYYIIIETSSSSANLQVTTVSNLYSTSKCTLLFNEPAILVNGIRSIEQVSIADIDTIMKFLRQIIKVPINKYTLGNNDIHSTFDLFDRNGIAKACNHYKIEECETFKKTKNVLNRLIYVKDSECKIEFMSFCSPPVVRPSVCHGVKIHDQNNKCFLVYQMQRPVILKLNHEESTNDIVRVSNFMLIPIHNCIIYLKIYIDDNKYQHILNSGFNSVSNYILNYEFVFTYVKNEKDSNLKINIVSCENNKLGSAYSSIFYKNPNIQICRGANSNQLIFTAIHEIFHIIGIPHDIQGIMRSIYDPTDTNINKYIINYIPSHQFSPVCTFSNSSMILTKMVHQFNRNLTLYSDQNNKFLMMRISPPIVLENIKNIPLIEEIAIKFINKIINKKPIQAYMNLESAFADNPNDSEEVTDIEFINVPTSSSCLDINNMFCTLVVAVKDIRRNAVRFLNLGSQTGLFRINKGKCVITCVSGIQINHAKCF